MLRMTCHDDVTDKLQTCYEEVTRKLRLWNLVFEKVSQRVVIYRILICNL